MQKNRWINVIAGCALTATTSFIIAAPITPLSPPSHVVQPQNAAPQVWNLKDADIRAVIQTMALLTGHSFIIDPQVQGRVTLISHTAMTTDEMYQVFLSMLRSMNFSAVTENGITHIVPSEQANILSRTIATNENPGFGNEVVIRVLPLNNVSATELVPVIRPLMSQSASVTAYMPTNALILAGTADNISRMVTLIHQMDDSSINQIRIIHLKYADASKVVSTIRTLQSAGESQGRVSNVAMSADENGNNILVNANAANQLLVKRLVEELDIKGSGGDNTIVVKLNYLMAKTLAPILEKVAAGLVGTEKGAAPAGSSPSSVSIQAETSNNALVLHGPKTILDSMKDVIAKLDMKPSQVLVEAIIVKLNETMLNRLGIIWGQVTNGQITGSEGNSTDSSSPPDNSFAFGISSHGVGFLPSGNLGMLLHMLKTKGNSDVLATPSIVVLNNQKASIDDGRNIGVSNTTYSPTPQSNPSGVPQTPYNAIDRQNVTLSLTVTPHISPNNMIRMDLVQKDDSLQADSSNESNSATPNPTINTSTIQTSVLVKSGDILVLGGLIQDDQTENKTKLPILGDLPFIGKLFQHHNHEVNKKSLMVFIRPIVMTTQSANDQTQYRYRYIRQQQIHMSLHKPIDTAIPILPKIERHGPIHLQSPLDTMALPRPQTTIQPEDTEK